MIPAPLQNVLDRLTVAWHERAVALKAVSFGLVGVVNSAVDFGVFSFAYYYLGLPIIAANALAWMVAVTGSYVMNSIHHLRRRIRAASSALEQLFRLRAVAGRRHLSPTPATVWCLVELLHIPAWAAKVAAIAVSFAVNFSLSHFVVFRARRSRNWTVRKLTLE